MKNKKEGLFQPVNRMTNKHTLFVPPKDEPSAHVARRDKDEEELKGLLTDLIRAEINKILEK